MRARTRAGAIILLHPSKNYTIKTTTYPHFHLLLLTTTGCFKTLPATDGYTTRSNMYVIVVLSQDIAIGHYPQ